jgi:hypothetical protein
MIVVDEFDVGGVILTDRQMGIEMEFVVRIVFIVRIVFVRIIL